MNPLDPAVAALRCWVHEDCLEHPELALACADGRVSCLGGDLDDDWWCRFWPTRDQHASCQRFSNPGDGYGVPLVECLGEGGDGFMLKSDLGVGVWHYTNNYPDGDGSGDPSWFDGSLRDDRP